MSQVFIVLAHPEPRSFNAAMAQRARQDLQAQGHQVTISDLYAMRFDPVSDRRNFTSVKNPDYLKQQIEEMHASEVNGFAADVEAEFQKLKSADVLILQFPLWWFGLPAILKGWVDRVLAMGRVYGGGRWYDNGFGRGKRAMVAMTTGGPQAMYQPGSLNPPMQHLLSPIQHGVFWFNGYHVLDPFIAWGPARLSDEQRAAVLDQFAAHLLAQMAAPGQAPPRVADFPPPSFQRSAN